MDAQADVASLSCVLTVWDSAVSELQRSAAEEVHLVTVLSACGEDLLSDITVLTRPPPLSRKPI